MSYKKILLVPEGTLFNEKSAQRAAINSCYKQLKQEQTSEQKELFKVLYTKYENSSRFTELKLILTALFAEYPLEQVLPLYLEALKKQSRLKLNAQDVLKQLTSKCDLNLLSFYPHEITTNRLNASQLTFSNKVFTNELFQTSSFSVYLQHVLAELDVDKNEILLIGNNLSDEIQAANDNHIPSMWITTNRKVPITPHPDLHVKKLADALFYFNN